LEKVPMVLSPGDGGAKVENLRYDRDGIEFRYSSASEAVLKVSNGLYGVPEGGVHQVLVNGRQHGKVIAKERELHIRIPAKERALLTVRKE